MIDFQKLLVALFAFTLVPAGKTEDDLDSLRASLELGYENSAESEQKAFVASLKNFANASRPAIVTSTYKAVLTNVATLAQSTLATVSDFFDATKATELQQAVKAALTEPATADFDYPEFVKNFNAKNLTRKGFNNSETAVTLSENAIGSVEKTSLCTIERLSVTTSIRDKEKSVIILEITDYKKNSNGTVSKSVRNVTVDANNLQGNVLEILIGLCERNSLPDAASKLKELLTAGSSIARDAKDASSKILAAYTKSGKAVRIDLGVIANVNVRTQKAFETTYTVNTDKPTENANDTYFNSDSAKTIAEIAKNENPKVGEIHVYHTTDTENLIAVSTPTAINVQETRRIADEMVNGTVALVKQTVEVNNKAAIDMIAFETAYNTANTIMNDSKLTVRQRTSKAKAALGSLNVAPNVIADIMESFETDTIV